jgi:hypothetical protein
MRKPELQSYKTMYTHETLLYIYIYIYIYNAMMN